MRTRNREAEMPLQAPPAVKGNYRYDAPSDQTEILWKCLGCGELKPRNSWIPGPCPSCGAPISQFVLVDED
jgi:rubrerythrin